MAITKDKKRAIVAKLTDAFKNATSVVFVGFSKLSVKNASVLRRELSQRGVQFFVTKKTLLRRALADSSYTGEIPELPGEIAIAWTTGEEITASAGSLHDFGKKLKGVLTLLGGVLEGSFVDAQKITAIANVPPLSVLRGMFANIINSPIQRLAIALSEVAKIKQ